MAKVPVAVRLDQALIDWADGYAEQRSAEDGVKVSRQVVLESAIESFRDDCESGVPELRAMVRRQSGVRGEEHGVGDCPRRSGALGHVWRSPQEDELRSCRFCGLAGRGPDGFFRRATAERTELFTRLVVPMQSGTGDPAKARSKGSK